MTESVSEQEEVGWSKVVKEGSDNKEFGLSELSELQQDVRSQVQEGVVTRDLGPASPALRVTAPCASLGKARVACTTTVAAPSTGGSASNAGS